MRQPLDLVDNKYYQSAQYSALKSLPCNVDRGPTVKSKALLESVRDYITDGNLKRAADSAGKRLDCRINPQSDPWKKQCGGWLHNGKEAGFTTNATPAMFSSDSAPRQGIGLFRFPHTNYKSTS